MKIISHRGYWRESSEKNKMIAFERSFSLGFGTETDLRDICGEVVISHDMPKGDEIRFSDFLKCYSRYSNLDCAYLALNIKSDGMAEKVSEILRANGDSQIKYFMFDMAIPDMLQYIKIGLPVYMRMSEVERDSSLLKRCNGIWLDSFDAEWYTDEELKQFLKNNHVCIVSSELHGRECRELWERLRGFKKQENLMLCTDFPEEFKKFIEA